MKYVVQWKCNAWVNVKGKDGNTRYFDSLEEAEEAKTKIRLTKQVEKRIVEYLGGRKYRVI